MKKLIKKTMIFLIRTYQMTISPRFSHGSCRFNPTCSQYAIDAIEIHGIFKGGLMAVWRILRCNPLSKGGWDPVPPKKSNEENYE